MRIFVGHETWYHMLSGDDYYEYMVLINLILHGKVREKDTLG